MAYPYTLQGHEHAASEDYERALTAYRAALRADKRHYNAYYGIAKVYEKLGNLDKAYTQYQAACSINPENAVLICNIGTVLEKQQHLGQALLYYTKATRLAPRTAYMRFKRARALFVLGNRETARAELMIVKDLTPNEATVHFLLGNLYKATNEKHQAMRHLTHALSLDPKVLHDMALVFSRRASEANLTNLEHRHHRRSRRPSKASTTTGARGNAGVAVMARMTATSMRRYSKAGLGTEWSGCEWDMGVGSWDLELGAVTTGASMGGEYGRWVDWQGHEQDAGHS